MLGRADSFAIMLTRKEWKNYENYENVELWNYGIVESAVAKALADEL